MTILRSFLSTEDLHLKLKLFKWENFYLQETFKSSSLTFAYFDQKISVSERILNARLQVSIDFSRIITGILPSWR